MTVGSQDNDKCRVEEPHGSWWCTTRFSISILGFLALLCMNAMRVSMSVAIVCMVNHTAVELLRVSADPDTNFTAVKTVETDSCQTVSVDPGNASIKDGEFIWDKKTQGLLLSAFFWGYMVAQVPAGWLASRFGGKRIIAGFLLATSISTILVPVGARLDWKVLMFLRFVAGMGGSVCYPGMHAMWGNWAPPLERSRLTGISYAGSQLGNVIGMPIAGLLCEYGFDGGWPALFYILGSLGLVWFVLWMFLVSDYPSTHPRISAEERAYIEDSLRGQVREDKSKLNVPWIAIMTSLPVWAIIISNIACDWALYTFETQTPTYLKEVLKFDIKSNGLISSVPYIGLWGVITFAGLLADFLRTRNILSTANTRKLMDCMGKMVMAVLVVALGFIHCSQWQIAVSLLIIGISLQGFQYSGFLVNHVDIAPTYAGILFGISNSIAALCGVAAPTVVGVLTQNQTRAEWQTVFYITAAVSISGAIFFSIFAKGELLPWAEQDKDEAPEQEKLNANGNVEEKISQV